MYFGNDFDNDSVKLILNDVMIVKGIKLKNTAISPQGLIIYQDHKKLVVRPHFGPSITLSKLNLKSKVLKVDISINNVWSHFKLDLKNGKYLIVEYPFEQTRKNDSLRIRQQNRGPLMV